MSSTYAIRGNLIFTKTPEKFTVLEHGYLICEDRTILGAFPGLPDRYRGMEVTDYGERLIIPGGLLFSSARDFASSEDTEVSCRSDSGLCR